MTNPLEFVPGDKSWFIRVAFLNFLRGIKTPLPDDPNDDIRSFGGALDSWGGPVIDVGESGTAFRFLQFFAWKTKLDKRFTLGAMLSARNICRDPEIVNLSQKQLLALDNGTSQWASAAALCGDPVRLTNPPAKLALTYEALDAVSPDPIRVDRTLLRQARAFQEALTSGHMDFTPLHSEDFCFAYAFGLVSAEEGMAKWPSLSGHESNRLDAMPAQMKLLLDNGVISSVDHRVVQALSMFALVNKIPFTVNQPRCAAKSWPRFWNFLSAVIES